MSALMSILTQRVRLEADRTPYVVCTVIATGGSTPRLRGTQLLVWASGFTGTIGGGAFEYRVIADARALLASDRQTATLDIHLVRDLAMCCGGKMSVFMLAERPTPKLWIFGAGHVGTALAKVAQLADFEVVVVDSRAEWADVSRFPTGIAVEDAEPEDWIRQSPPAAEDMVVILTHDHALDESLIRRLAPLKLRFLGLIGSRGKWARFRNRLEARGIELEALDRVRCPVGLDINGQTPGEIAVSIVAELVATRRG